MKRLQFFFLFLLPIALLARVPNEALFPLNNQRVHDQTGTLSSYEINNLSSLCEDLEQSAGAQYVIVLVNSTSPYTIEDYGFSLGEYWELGTEKADNGILMLIAIQDRKMRIEVGYGLEGVIPDALAKRIIETQLKPSFRNGDFYGGILEGSKTIKELILEEPVSSENFKEKKLSGTTLKIIGVFSFPFLLVFLFYLKDKYGYFKGVIPGLLLIGVIVYFITNAPTSIMYTVILWLFTAFPGGTGGSGGSRRYSGGVGYGRSYSGGFSGGSFGGGFSGGGGSFGGGGSSGSW